MKKSDSSGNIFNILVNDILKHPIIAGLIVFALGSLIFNSDKFFRKMVQLGEYTVRLLESIDNKIPLPPQTIPSSTILKPISPQATVTPSTIPPLPPAPTANFTVSIMSGSAPLDTQFTDTSTGTITNRFWDFGDGENSTTQNPSHTYNKDGTYAVTLIVAGPGGASNPKTDIITVTASTQLTPKTSNTFKNDNRSIDDIIFR